MVSGFERRFSAVSGSLGASYALSDTANIGLNLSRTERAPSSLARSMRPDLASTTARRLTR